MDFKVAGLRGWVLAGLVGVFVVFAGCGGSTAVGPSVSAVTVTCSPAMVAMGGSVTCTAAVTGTGTYSSAVSWAASGGTITAGGVLTAPATAGGVTVTATSTQDGTKSGAATVTVQAAPPVISSIAVTCTPATVMVSGMSQCGVVVSGTGSYSSSVTWAASAGTIAASGMLTAPDAVGSVTVTATSTQDTTKTGTAVVTVTAPVSTISSVAVACTPASVPTNGTSLCAATVQGMGSFSSAVAWTASAGTIDANGALTAPATTGSITVTATSTQDSTKTGTAVVTVTATTAMSQHVVLMMEENSSYSTVVGQTAVWPNLNKLIGEGALPTHYYADSHPSIGNYLMLTTGQTLTTDDSSVQVWDVDNIARRMLASGVSFRIYAEGIAQGYVGGNTGLYLIRHNPFALLSDVANDAQVANAVIYPFSQFAIDVANGTLPQFSYIVPDVDDDAHNGTPQQADAWLQANVVTPLSSYPAFETGGDGILIVDFDEAEDSDTAHGGGHVSPVLWGPNVKVGYKQKTTTVYQHESMLRTMMDELGLPAPPGAAATAPSMSEFLVEK